MNLIKSPHNQIDCKSLEHQTPHYLFGLIALCIIKCVPLCPTKPQILVFGAQKDTMVYILTRYTFQSYSIRHILFSWTCCWFSSFFLCVGSDYFSLIFKTIYWQRKYLGFLHLGMFWFDFFLISQDLYNSISFIWKYLIKRTYVVSKSYRPLHLYNIVYLLELNTCFKRF